MTKPYILNEVGEGDIFETNSIVPPIVQSSTFKFKNVAEFRKAFDDYLKESIYTRGNNPTVEILRKKMAFLEHAEDALILACGSAAIASSVLSFLKTGDHLICVKNPYSWTNTLITDFLKRYGVEHDFVDGTKFSNFKKAIRKNTKLIYLESPNSLTFELQDLAEIASLAKTHNIKTIIDNSYATPINQNPIDLGIDIVIHSASKYLGGHSDIVAGVICGSEKDIRRIYEHEYMTLGAIISPHDAWLLLRSLRTLHMRVEKATSNNEILMEYLEKHDKVLKVLHPFHPDNPQIKLAKKQMKNCGGLLSFYLDVKNASEADRFVDQLHHFVLSVSWGAYEPQVLPISTFCALDESDPSKNFNLIRLSCGTGDIQVLIDDLEQAFISI